MFSELFNEPPTSTQLQSYLAEVASCARVDVPDPAIRSYPDAVYFNYYTLGVSFLFHPSTGGTKYPLNYETISLGGIDIYNTAKDVKESKGKTYSYSQFPLLPMKLPASPSHDSIQNHFDLKAESTGQDLVRALGEPTRKGGGAGPSAGSISIWCEWSSLGIMVEFGGDDARGPQAWERGKDAVWKVVTLFPPKDSSV